MASDIRTYEGTFRNIFDLCISAANKCNWTVTISDDNKGIIKAQYGVSLLSWGEDIEIELERMGKTTKVMDAAQSSVCRN